MQNVMDSLRQQHAVEGAPPQNQPEIQHRLDINEELVGYFVGFQPAPAGAANRWVISDTKTGMHVVSAIWNDHFPKENGIGLEGTLISLRCELGRTYVDPWTAEEKKIRTYRLLSLDREPAPEPQAQEEAPAYNPVG